MNLPSREIQFPYLLIAIIALAVMAQAFMYYGIFTSGIFFYLLSMIGFFLWAGANPSSIQAITRPLHLNRQSWLVLLGIVILLTVSSRFFNLNSRVYGLDADETKWNVQAWQSQILHGDVTAFFIKHYQYQPVDFWVRSIFLRIFGVNFIAARVESAVLSLIAVFSLYLLAKLVTSNTAIGLITALIFSLSFIELNASHQALYSTPPMAWMLSSLALCFTAIRYRKAWQFQMSGILLGLGMLTYDTFYPNFAVVFIYLLTTAIFEVKRRQESIKHWGLNLFLVIWPTIFVYFTFIRIYLNQDRQSYLFGLLKNALTKDEFLSLAQFFSRNISDVFETIFWQIRWGDSLINWNGPLLNPLILPFIGIGLVYNLWSIRQAHFAFIPLLFVMHIATGPILLGAVWPRVLYLAVPALMIWAGLGLWIMLVALGGIFRDRHVYVPPTIFALILIAILVNDHLIFTTRLIDPLDHQKRRELSDLTIASAKGTSILLYPFMAGQKDFVELDSHVITYSIAGEKDLGIDAINRFGLVHMTNFLHSLWANRDNGEIDVIFDKTAPTRQDERISLLQVVLSCYPGAQLLQEGTFFDVYHFDRQVLHGPKCYSPQQPVNISPTGILSQADVSLSTFKWDADEIQSNGYIFTLDKKMIDTIWVEVEQSFSGKGWLKESLAVSSYSGEGYLIDSGAGRTGEAEHTLEIETPGKYYIWFRTYKRWDNDQHNFVLFNGTKTEIAKGGQHLNEWTWESIGVYELPVGPATITLTREYGRDAQYSTFIDAMVVTTNAQFKPDTENEIWQNVFTLSNLTSTDTTLTLPDTLSTGSYRWHVRIFSPDHVVDANGNPWIESEPTTFHILE